MRSIPVNHFFIANTCVCFVFVCVSNVLFVLTTNVLLFLFLLFFFFQMYYRPVNRDLQRLESVSRSPIFAQFSETLSGVSTLRAYNQQARLFFCLCDLTDV